MDLFELHLLEYLFVSVSLSIPISINIHSVLLYIYGTTSLVAQRALNNYHSFRSSKHSNALPFSMDSRLHLSHHASHQHCEFETGRIL